MGLEDAAQARAALAAGDRVEALRVCAQAMAEELTKDEVEAMVEVLDEIRKAPRSHTQEEHDEV